MPTVRWMSKNHPGGQLLGGETVGVEVGGHVHEHLVDRVDVDILRGHILEIDLVDLRAVLHVQGHPGRGHNVVQAHGGVSSNLVSSQEQLASFWPGAFRRRSSLICFTRWITSNSLARPEMP